jgi:splicing factor 3B subunit 2
LQNKRGLEKPPFELPAFIKATGILEMRDALESKDAESRLKQKTRERLQPKMGKLVIDYAKLHDAFFKWQTKPNLSIYGELYYEGREFETKLRSARPGAPLSESLREALGMPPLAPPPWLVHMQRHGPPPSYPGLRIPGLNSPIPPGSQWGFHPGGWGKPPVDEYGRPLYGDVFANPFDPSVYANNSFSSAFHGTDMTQGSPAERWGEIPEVEEAEDEEDDEEQDVSSDEEEQEPDDQQIITGDIVVEQEEDEQDMEIDDSGPSITKIPITELSAEQLAGEAEVEADLEAFVADLEGTGDAILRKSGEAAAVESNDLYGAGLETPSLATPAPPKELYTVIGERTASARGQLMGSDRLYDIRKPRPAGLVDEDGDTPLPSAVSARAAGARLAAEEDAAKKKSRKEDKKRKDFKF